MKNLVKGLLLVCFGVICQVLSSSGVVAQNKRVVSQEQAVEVAEKFVANHGNTKSLAKNEPNIYWESIEESASNERVARSRSIQSRAVVALIKEENGRAFWSVQFLFRKQRAEREYDLGREVRVSLDGRKARMASQIIPVWKARQLGDCLGEGEPPKPE